MAKAIGISKYGDVGNYLFFQPTDKVQSRISNRFQNFVANARNSDDQFIDSVTERFNNAVENQTLRIDDLFKQRISSVFKTNKIRHLSTISDIQEAPDIMRRWIMAAPVVRERYQNKVMSGYSGKFDDPFPNQRPGPRHHDYRRVMNGIVYREEDELVTHRYIDGFNTTELTTAEKAYILKAWSVMEQALKDGDNSDPTSVWNGLL
jgi:hypothetical protein